MKKIILLLVFLFFASPVFAEAAWVDGYVRRDGTYVPGYYRSSPNNYTWDNYSTKGNTNPYTGKEGYVYPYKTYEPFKPKTMSPSPYEYKNPYGW